MSILHIAKYLGNQGKTQKYLRIFIGHNWTKFQLYSANLSQGISISVISQKSYSMVKPLTYTLPSSDTVDLIQTAYIKYLLLQICYIDGIKCIKMLKHTKQRCNLRKIYVHMSFLKNKNKSLNFSEK